MNPLDQRVWLFAYKPSGTSYTLDYNAFLTQDNTITQTTILDCNAETTLYFIAEQTLSSQTKQAIVGIIDLSNTSPTLSIRTIVKSASVYAVTTGFMLTPNKNDGFFALTTTNPYQDTFAGKMTIEGKTAALYSTNKFSYPNGDTCIQ